MSHEETDPAASRGPVGQASLILLLGLFSLMFAAFVLLHQGWGIVQGTEMSAPRALFNVVNAATLTGFQTPVNINEFKPLGQILIFILTYCGALVSLLIGGWGMVRVLHMPYTNRQIVVGAVGVHLTLLIIAAIVLSGGSTDRLWTGIFQANSAFSNSGLVIGAVPGLTDYRLHLILLPLSVIGGLGVPVLLDIGGSIAHLRRLHTHTAIVLSTSAALYLFGTIGIAGFVWQGLQPDDSDVVATTVPTVPEQPFFKRPDVQQALLVGSAESLNSRALGLPLDTFATLARPAQWIILLLMVIGSNPAGTGGGMRASTFYVFLRDALRLMRGEMISRLSAFATLWVVVYLAAIFLTTVALISCEQQAAGDRLLFLAVSAIGNVGTAHGPVSLSANAMYVLSLAMCFGRFAPLAMLWWANRIASQPDTTPTPWPV